MANTYSVTRTGWLYSLANVFFVTNEIDRDQADLDAQAFKFFRWFLAFKIVTSFAIGYRHLPLSIKLTVVLLTIFLVALPRYYLLGLCIILGLSFSEIVRTWPFTINHAGLEFSIVLLMCLLPEDESKRPRISPSNLIKILMLSVWFYSGIHKLVGGYYLNGEFFALEALLNERTLGRHLNQIMDHIASFLGPFYQDTFTCCQNTAIPLVGWQAGIFLVFSWLTIIVELVLPFSLLSPKFRNLGILGLFIAQGFIAYFSGEIDFAFTAFGVLFLFIPQFAKVSYPALACLFLMVRPWM